MDGLPFDPATGDWRPAPPRPGQPAPASPSPSRPPSRPPGLSPPPAPAALPPAAPPEARKPDGGRGWDVVLAIDVVFLALLFGLAAVAVLEGQELTTEGTEPGRLRDALYIQSVMQVLLMAVLPLAWGFGTRLVPLAGTLRYFRLDRPLRSALLGVGLAAAMLAGVVVLGLIFDRAGYQPENPVLDEVVAAIDWPLMLVVAAAAAIGEEVFFRGWMLRALETLGLRMGLGQRPTQVVAVGVSSVAFGLAHFGYGTPLQVVVPLLVGIVFAVLLLRGGSLWMLIVAHFLYDVAAFAAAKYAGEMG